MQIKLARGEEIAAVVPERFSGPGWSNAAAVVYITNQDGTYRMHYIQPEEMPRDLVTLFDAGAAMCKSLRDAVNRRRTE
jgi:hypothetical protein